MADRRRMLIYYGRILLATTAFLGLLLILAILAELYTALDEEQIAPDNLSHLFTVPGIGLRLIRDMLPGILAVSAALFLASNFIASLYKLSNWREGAGHIRRCIFGQPAFAPFVLVVDGKVDVEGSNGTLMRIGGPGSILTYNDSAVVLEQGGRLTRVVEPGKMDALGRFEKVRDVIDVRPMRWEYRVNALSKEGIPVVVYANVHFQIDTGGRESTAETPFPALDEAVFRASVGRWMRHPEASEDDQSFDWARRVIISETEGALRGIVARYPLDALVGLTGVFSTSSVEHPRRVIQEELTGVLRESAARLGVQINKARLGAIKVNDEVAQQWVEVWQNEWRAWSMVQEKTGEATREQLRETAKAQAQVDVITAVARAFQQAVSRDARIPSQLLVMRLIEVFDHFAIEPSTRIYLPTQAIETLDRLRDLVG